MRSRQQRRDIKKKKLNKTPSSSVAMKKIKSNPVVGNIFISQGN